MITAANLMRKEVVVVSPETPLMEAISQMVKNGFTGLPIVQGGMFIGVLMSQDMIVRGTSIHLPTFIKLFGKLHLYKKDANLIKKELGDVVNLKVGDVMGRNFFSVGQEDSLVRISGVFVESNGLDPIPVVDSSKMLVGLIRKEDFMRELGDREKDARLIEDAGNKEKSVNVFLDNFSKKFMLVSRSRARFWIVTSILFVIVGFVVAFALILRINK